jgi:signal peptidase I
MNYKNRESQSIGEFDNSDKKKGEFNLLSELLSWISVIVIAAGIALVLNNFIIANSRVPSASMENTIMTKDRIIGLRMAYMFSEPQRGDIIIFRYPDDEKVYYVKRIIGIPGDVIDIVDGKVYLNNSSAPLDEPYLKEAMIPEAPMHFEVPEEGYFCLGDNRNNSKDARRWKNTYVYKDKIIAKVVLRYFPNIHLLK